MKDNFGFKTRKEFEEAVRKAVRASNEEQANITNPAIKGYQESLKDKPEPCRCICHCAVPQNEFAESSHDKTCIHCQPTEPECKNSPHPGVMGHYFNKNGECNNCGYVELLREKEDWEREITIQNHEWLVRLIKFGEAKIPKSGFYTFQNPDLIPFIASLLQEQREDIVERIEELKKGTVITAYWRRYNQYPKKGEPEKVLENERKIGAKMAFDELLDSLKK